MANDFGTGVSRVLDPTQASWAQVIWQEGKPPLDSELNLIQQISVDWRRIATMRGTPSGWLGNAVNPSEVFNTGATWSNWFRFGQQRTGEKQAIPWAAVNGWLVPVTGTLTGTPPGSPNDSDTWNRITLDPGPSNSGDSRIDFAFLEVWLARVPPNPSTSNKPGASTIYRYGNVEGGYTYLADDLQDPAIGFESTQRVQLQYRIRVVTGLIGLTSYPDGFDPTVVKARGAATAATSYVFENMREELGDPGLWRAGDGTSNALGTVDGYTYAVPICAVFRRNSVAWDGDPGQNLNGGYDRNPTAVDRTGYTTFSTTPTLAADLGGLSTDLTATLLSATDIPMPATPATAVTIQIGDEMMTYSAISGTTMTLASRGAFGTKIEPHSSGDTITVVSGRPDGLFTDQIAKTDILDLRHVVNPNGFDYDSLLQQNLDKLLRGQLRANWKRSGGGPQGGFVFYQDKISNSAAALGVTKLDGPDGHRTVFSDAAIQQPMEFIASPPAGKSVAEDISTTWSLSLDGTVDNSGGVLGQFNGGDVISIPVSQLKTGIPGGDTDQVRFLGDEGGGDVAVSMRIDGDVFDLVAGTHFSVNTPGPTDDLEITLLGGFPAGIDRKIYITLHVQYGPGRGLSRRPDSVHSISFLSTSTEVMSQLSGVPANNIPTRAAWALLWSQFRDGAFRGLLPVTAESYVDPGSKTIVLRPYREIELPTKIQVLDGSAVNVNTDWVVFNSTTGTTTAGNTFTDVPSGDFVTDGVVGGTAAAAYKDVLVIHSPASVAGTYWVDIGVNPVAATSFDVDRVFPAAVAGTVSYTLYHTQGLMPLLDKAGAAKWATTDPLELFSGETEGGVGTDTATKNLYVPLPRKMVPGWGEVRVPIMHSDPTTTPPGGSSTFDQGVNFGVMAKKGAKAARPESEANYTSLLSQPGLSYAAFSTWDWSVPVSATYNTKFTYSGIPLAGMRFFSDTRGLGRKGLELPPFYGIARLFAVYAAGDYGNSPAPGNTNLSDFNSDTREPTGGGSTNLLRQDFDGPVFWIESDDDGDATFIINADAIDLAKAPFAIADFESGQYVIEASVFGFDRDSFDLTGGAYINDDARLVLARTRPSGEADSGTRTNNFGTGSSAEIYTPDLVVPGPVPASTEVAINYTRSPYQGDAWGSQSSQQDIGHQLGPITTGTMWQLTSTELDEQNLTRPNQKALEVLSSIGFMTTLGSGRLAGDVTTDAFDPRNVGYELQNNFPPTSGSDPRPNIEPGALDALEETLVLGTEYHNCVERLPLGAFFRDKDFRGGLINSESTSFRPSVRAPLVFSNTYAPGIEATGVGLSSNIEQTEVGVNTSSLASGQPGEMVAHVDGESGNYSLLTNFRTNRGGSAFTLSGLRPGGECSATYQKAGDSDSYPVVLSGTAYLVRNTVTTIGSTEVSAGSEIMMALVTHGKWLDPTDPTDLSILSGTNGTGEGFSAVDLYRVEGRPLAVDHVRVEVDPSSITLSKKVPLI
jgi:hypothetical protein